MSDKSNAPAAKAEKAEKPAKAETPAKADKAETPAAKTAEKPADGKGDKSETPKDPASGYARGEGQKPVSPRYRSNWDNIFGKKR
jgi:hypothetical protein